jgi:hypothetical protein
MTLYRTGKYSIKIDAVEVERATDSSVWVFPFFGSKLRRYKKHSAYEDYFDTWAEAKTFLQSRSEHKIQSLRMQLNVAEGTLGNVRGMIEPEKEVK